MKSCKLFFVVLIMCGRTQASDAKGATKLVEMNDVRPELGASASMTPMHPGYYRMHSRDEGIGFPQRGIGRMRAPSLTRSLSHPDRLDKLTEEVDATLGLSSVLAHGVALGETVLGEEMLDDGASGVSTKAVAVNPNVEAIRLLARRTKEANDDRRAHENLVAQHLKESRELAQRAEARALAADQRAARARKMAILFAIGNGVATVGGWVWSSGMLHRWFGFDDGTGEGGD